MQQGVPLDLGGERLELFSRRQLPVDEQVADLDEVRLLRELLDRIAAVAQDPGVAIDVGDGALGRRGIDETLVVRGVAGLGQQRTEGDAVGAFGGVDHVQFKLATGIVESGVLVFFGHGDPFYVARNIENISGMPLKR